MKLFQIWKQIKLECHIARANADLARFQVLHAPQHRLPVLYRINSPSDIRQKQFSLARQLHAARCPQKKAAAKRGLQLSDRLADRRLGNAECLCGRRDAAAFAHAAKYPPYDNRLSGRGNDYPEPESLAEGTFPHYDTALRPDKHRSTSHLVRTEGSAEKVILMTCQTGCAN